MEVVPGTINCRCIVAPIVKAFRNLGNAFKQLGKRVKLFKTKRRFKVEQVIKVESKDGILKLGNDILDLNDESKSSFTTDDFESFVEYSKVYGDKASIYYSEKEIKLIPKGEARQNNLPLAICNMSNSPALTLLINCVNKKQDIQKMEDFLKTMKGYLNEEGLKFLSNIQDFSISKITKIVRKKDNRGNYTFIVEKEDAGNAEYLPPETINFTIPIFKHLNDSANFVFDIVFDYTEAAPGEVYLYFKLENLNFTELLVSVFKKITTNIIKSVELPKYYGNYELIEMTDEWRYKENILGAGDE